MMDPKFDQLDKLQEKTVTVERERAGLMAEILVGAIRKKDHSAILQLIGSVAGSQLSAERLLTAVRDQMSTL